MDIDSVLNADSEEQLQLEMIDDSCRHELFEIVPLVTDADGSCTTERVNGHWSAEDKQENLSVVKHEPDSVY